jgi:hypothetical protein
MRESGKLYAVVTGDFEELEQTKEQWQISHACRGFHQGGKVIGQLERNLVFICVIVGLPNAIGFLITAKSIFRFGEIKEHRYRMEAEYIIIGTMMSFSYGIITAYITKFFLNNI